MRKNTNKNLIQDERISQIKRKIGHDTCWLLLLILMMGILFQQYVLKAPLSQYAFELFCLIGASIYILVRGYLAGIDYYGSVAKNDVKKTLNRNAVISALTIIIVNGGLSYFRNPSYFIAHIWIELLSLAFGFILALILLRLMMGWMYRTNDRKQQQIRDALDHEEDDNQ